MVKAIVGTNWGDKSKGKITDLSAKPSDVAIRFQGGSNVGDTINCDYGHSALHQLPSGAFYPHTTRIIGSGDALDIDKLLSESEQIKNGGVPPPHILVEQYVQALTPECLPKEVPNLVCF